MEEEPELGEVGVERAQEQAEEHGHGRGWTRWLALSTALFAVLAAIASLKSGHYANEALLHGNEATLKQAEASDQWSYYQAKGIKSVTREVEAELLQAAHAPTEQVAQVKASADRYQKEQDEIQHQAHELGKERAKLEEESAADLTNHQRFAYVVTMLQVTIGLSAVAALINRRSIWIFSLLIGALGSAFLTWNMIRLGIV